MQHEIDDMVDKLLDMDLIKEDNSVSFSDEAKQLIHEIAEKCNTLSFVKKTKDRTQEYADLCTAEQVYVDMLYEIIHAPTALHMILVVRALIPVIDQKLREH